MCFSVTIHLPSFEEYLLNTDAVGSAPPDAFGPFRVLHQIGAGALGPVFRAYQPEQDRLVAVKLFRLDLPPEKTHQLVAELEKLIAADLTHPGIAAPLATGISDVWAYLAQDFVAAESLDTVVRDMGRSEPSDIARVAAQLGGALDLAAVIGMTHGALHPRDVLLSADDVRMTGIGITRALERVGVAAPIRRPYTAPERAAGGAWDRRADVFSLGALLFELLFRRRITGSGDQPVELFRDVAGANAEALRRAFARALAEDPDDRFPTAGDFARAVQGAFTAKRTASGRTSPKTRAAATPPAATLPVATASVARALEEPTEFVPEPFMPVPAEDLPLLTDAMLSAAVGDLLRPEPSAIEHDPAHLALDLSTTESRRSTLDEGDDHRVSDNYRLTDDSGLIHDSGAVIHDSELIHDSGLTDDSRLATQRFDPAEILEPDVAESTSHLGPAAVEAIAANDRSSQGVWPLMLALIVGIGLGFGMAMLLLGRDRVPSASEQAVAAIAAERAPVEIRDEPIREFTERAVASPASPPPAASAVKPPAPAKPAAAPVAAAPVAAAPAVKAPVASAVTNAPVAAQPPVATTAATKAPVAKAAGTKPPVPKASPPAPAKRSSAAPVASRPTARPAAAAPKTTAPPLPVKTGPGSLAVDSRPAGASVFVDGKLIGTTPLVVTTLGPGEHAIHLDRDGYRRWATAVRITSGERSKVAASLER